jgi:hypothetical protein
MPLNLQYPTDSQHFAFELNVVKEYVNGLLNVPPPEYLAAVAFYMATQVELVPENTYTLTSNDHNKIKDFTNASGCIITVPSTLDSNVLGVPFTCGIGKGSTGNVTIAAGAGAIVNAPGGFKTMNVQYGFMTITEWPDGSFRVYGGTA